MIRHYCGELRKASALSRRLPAQRVLLSTSSCQFRRAIMTIRVKPEPIETTPSLQLLEKDVEQARKSFIRTKWFNRGLNVVVAVSFFFFFGLGGYAYYRGKQINDELDKRSKSTSEKVDKLCEELQESVVAAGKCLDGEEVILQKLITKAGGDASTDSAALSLSGLDKSQLLKDVSRRHGEVILQALVEPSSIDDVRLAQIHGNEAAKRVIEESVLLPLLNPQLFSGLRSPSKGILLYGPPGNGKTMLAKAVANEAQVRFFHVSAATIMSKWMGEDEKIIQALFQDTVSQGSHGLSTWNPCLILKGPEPEGPYLPVSKVEAVVISFTIFIDEIDSLLCKRQTDEYNTYRQVKTELMLRFDGCTTSRDDGVLVLGATNRPYDLDEGALRRFSTRVFVDLLEAETRVHFIQTTFEEHSTALQMTDKDWRELAKCTQGYSFSDLLALCRAAAMEPLEEVRNKQGLAHISASDLRPVNYEDLTKALKRVTPSADQKNLAKIRKFARSGTQLL